MATEIALSASTPSRTRLSALESKRIPVKLSMQIQRILCTYITKAKQNKEKQFRSTIDSYETNSRLENARIPSSNLKREKKVPNLILRSFGER